MDKRYGQFFHLMEALPIFSGDLVKQANEGEAYETLVRRIHVLHKNIEDLAAHAKELKRQASVKTSAKKLIEQVPGKRSRSM